jgi:lysophospholipase L1-like esterase
VPSFATAIVAVLSLLLISPATSGAAKNPTYLALGDSLAFGYSQARFESLLPEVDPAAFDTGYVDDFGHLLQFVNRRLEIVNDGCPGETTSSFIEGPCKYQLAFRLHHPYAGGIASSQLSDALAVISAHPNNVETITLDIGANDTLGLLSGCKQELACVEAGLPGLIGHLTANLGLILSDLRSAAPHARIIVLGLYNPFGAILPGGSLLTEVLNETMAAAAAAVHARFADPLPLFNPGGALEAPTICALTNMCQEKPDIHPTDLGYAALAAVIAEQYVLSLPPGHHSLPPGFFVRPQALLGARHR